MKIYYYTFTPEGKVIKDNLTVRKNKYSYVIGAGFYGGMEHRCPKKLYKEDEEVILCADSTALNGCYMFSGTIKEVTEEMKTFAVRRAEKIQELDRIRNEIYKIASDFKQTIFQYWNYDELVLDSRN